MTSNSDELMEVVRQEMQANYSQTVIDHALRPMNLGSMPDCDGFARVTGSCGDTMEIRLRVVDGQIRETRFLTDGCAATIASASMVTELARGKKAAEAARISQQDVLEALGGLPQGNVHCALLASNTLREAVKDYLKFKNEPWKRAYRRQC
jgi:nitrogen fixation NifU-like protein